MAYPNMPAQRNQGADNLSVCSQLHTLDLTAACIQVTHDVAHEFLGRRHFDLHNRLEHNGRPFLDCRLKCHRTGDFERHFGRIHLVIGPIHELHTDINDGKSRYHTVDHCLFDASFNRANVFTWHDAADDFVDELESRAAIERSDLKPHMSKLTATTGLTNKPPSAFTGFVTVSRYDT